MKKFACFLFFVFLCSIFHLSASNLPEPYNSLKVLPENPFGWYSNAAYIEDIFQKNKIRVVIEVGSWAGGGSTRHMGNLLKQSNGKLYAVDTWLGSSTMQPGQVHYQPLLSYVYQQFLSNMVHWGLCDVVIPCRMKSLEASKALNVHPDLIYVDGEHTTEAVYEDLNAWYPFVCDHGILCGDDWGWPTVRAAVEQFAAQNNLIIDSYCNFWRLRKP